MFSVVLFLVVALSVVPWLRRRLSYERWHAVHLLTYVAIALGFVHQLAGPDLAGNRVAQVAWAQLYCLAFFLSLRYRFVEPLRQARRHRLVVDRVQRESHDTVSIWLRGRHLSELAARPGQFFRWRFLTAQTWMSAHPFSLSALPEGDRLRITVKALGDGSRRLHELESGVRVLAEGPYGRAESGWRPTLLIAGGVGITPLRALFEAHAVDGLPTTLLYRASSPGDVLFRSELDELAARHHARVIYVLGPSGDPANALTAAALTALLPDLLVHDVFVCASPRLSAAVRESLRAAGLPARQLHDESLSF
jgi:predicted ferric reductase